MQKPTGMLVRLSLTASLISLGCVPTPVFPTPAPVVVLPLRDPVIGPGLSVSVTLPGRDGPWSAWMVPDSGAYCVIFPSAWLTQLGASYVDRGEMRIKFVLPPVENGRWGLLSTMSLGDLVVRDAPTEVTFDSNKTFFGQSILAHAPWEIDWDRGTLTLGARRWPDAPDIVVVPLRHRGFWDVLTLQVDGHPVDMVLDTGAELSIIPVDIGKRSGLAAQDVDRRTHPREKEISGEVVLGSLRLGRIGFPSIPGVGLGYGLLGRDILSAYRIQVIPGERLALRPRGDTWETAPQRIARWPWTRGCEHPGCIRARFEPVGADARVVFSFEVDHPHPLGVLLGCRDADPVGFHMPTAAQRVTSGRSTDVGRHVYLSVASAAKGQNVEALVKWGGSPFFTTGAGSRCRDLSVLDVVPLDRERLGGKAVAAELFF